MDHKSCQAGSYACFMHFLQNNSLRSSQLYDLAYEIALGAITPLLEAYLSTGGDVQTASSLHVSLQEAKSKHCLDRSIVQNFQEQEIDFEEIAGRVLNCLAHLQLQASMSANPAVRLLYLQAFDHLANSAPIRKINGLLNIIRSSAEAQKKLISQLRWKVYASQDLGQ